jgi:DNA-binding CsgD family transcriptional regulator
MPEDLIPPAYRDKPMKKNVGRFTMDEGDVELLTSSMRNTAALPFDAMVKDEAYRKLHDVLTQVLNPREHRVVSMRYGLGDSEAKTLEEIARAFGVQRERIRQIEQRAIRKLKDGPSRGVVKDVFHSLCCEGADLPNIREELDEAQRLWDYREAQEKVRKDEALKEALAGVKVSVK